jgi:uncharacterized Ntn-hydrolase superfamily protein
MFTATEYEYNRHDYDPNTPKGGLIDNSLDFLPAGRSAGVALGDSAKVGSEALRVLNGKIDGVVDEALDVRVNPLDGTEATLEEVRRGISTAKDYQSKEPRTLHEQLTIEEVKANPEIGRKIGGEEKRLNNDPLFHRDDGFQKMSYTHESANGENIEVHYQYHKESGKVYDIKIEDEKLKKEFQGAKR